MVSFFALKEKIIFFFNIHIEISGILTLKYNIIVIEKVRSGVLKNYY